MSVIPMKMSPPANPNQKPLFIKCSSSTFGTPATKTTKAKRIMILTIFMT
jgi:hypothetical protein